MLKLQENYTKSEKNDQNKSTDKLNKTIKILRKQQKTENKANLKPFNKKPKIS